MDATVSSFRRGRHTQNNRQMVIKIADSAEGAQKLVGKTVIWTSPAGNEIKGKISALHGRNGSVRALFTAKGLPGQSLGQKVRIE